MNNRFVIAFCSILFLVSCAGLSAAGDDVGMVSVATLHEALADPGLKIIDVRDAQSWASSNEKIPGAIREDPDAVPMWTAKYGPSDRIVLCCA